MDPSNQNEQENSGLLRLLSAPVSMLDGFDSICTYLSSNEENSSLNQHFLPPQYPRQAVSSGDSSYALSVSRQNSSPAGLFANISFQNGYTSINATGSYEVLNGSHGEACPSPKRLKSQLSFSSGMVSQISDVLAEGVETESSNNAKVENADINAQFYNSGYAYGSWNESVFEDNIANGAIGNHVHTLSHHMSLPKSSSQMVPMEKILQFQENQDTVPWKIRAKRGCATHPRSIAERMRRTRISERMRKLQDLVPNMDRQTNTTDMLDLAVEYIKDLQKQFKTLSDTRAKCKCLNTEKPVPSQSS